MSDGEIFDMTDLDTREVSLAVSGIDGEFHAAVDWFGDAFGGIEAEVGTFAPVLFIKRLFRLN